MGGVLGFGPGIPALGYNDRTASQKVLIYALQKLWQMMSTNSIFCKYEACWFQHRSLLVPTPVLVVVHDMLKRSSAINGKGIEDVSGCS
jgi:hypothetical protein